MAFMSKTVMLNTLIDIQELNNEIFFYYSKQYCIVCVENKRFMQFDYNKQNKRNINVILLLMKCEFRSKITPIILSLC